VTSNAALRRKLKLARSALAKTREDLSDWNWQGKFPVVFYGQYELIRHINRTLKQTEEK
jgi:hypothetical protein